jgi:hypothetical protein
MHCIHHTLDVAVFGADSGLHLQLRSIRKHYDRIGSAPACPSAGTTRQRNKRKERGPQYDGGGGNTDAATISK